MNMHVGGAGAQRVRFKIGDKVRVVVPGYDSESGHGASAGEEHVVERVDDDGVETEVWYFFNNEIEPVATAALNRFKVGDRVRAIESSGGGAVTEGAVYTVTDAYDDTIRFVNNNGRADGWNARFFEPVAVAEQQQLTIQAGKYYRTRDGRKVGPMVRWSDYSVWPWSDHMTAGSNIWNDSGKNGNEDEDLIAEWQDEPVKAEPKFTVGDRVICPTVPEAGVGIIEAIKPEGGYRVHYADSWYGYCHGSDDDLAEAPVTHTSPAIVCRLDNGRPLPARKPYVHASVADASKEATRLAKANPGREFAVYEMVHSVTEEPQHEWQRLAASGDRDAAAAELHRLTGMHHSDGRYIADRYTRAA